MIIESAERELREKGDISICTADNLYSAFMQDIQFQERVNYISWYLFVLEKLRKQEYGNFITTIPFIWITGDVFSVIRECLRILPLNDRINEIIARDIPDTDIPGCYVSREARHSLVSLRAGIADRVYPEMKIIPGSKLVGFAKWAKDIEAHSLEETLTCCIMDSAERAGIKVGTVCFSAEDKWINAAPFCDKDNFSLFSRLVFPDLQVIKFNVLKSGRPAEIPTVKSKIFTDCDCFFSTGKGIIFHKGKECYLFDEKNIKEVLIQGVSFYIDELRERINQDVSAEDLEIGR